MLKLRSVVVALLFFSLSGFSKTPPEGTAITISYSGTVGSTTHAVYEEATTCLDQILTFQNSILLKAAQPVYRPQRPGATRVFALGANLTGQSELWIIDPSVQHTKKLGYPNVVSLTPYSNQEVLIGLEDGTIIIVDDDGRELQKYSVASHFPQSFTIKEIGKLVRAWRSGISSFSVLTQNHFVLFDGTRSVIIALNPTTPVAPRAYVPSFDLGNVMTAIGDEKHVWIVHDWTTPTATPSFSLFDLSNGAFPQRHVAPPQLRAFGEIQPVYYESASRTGYFAMADSLMGATPTSVIAEKPKGQFAASSFGVAHPGTPMSVVISPPVQGTPWAAQSPGWITPPWSQRGAGGTATLARKPPFSNPQVTNSTVAPAAVSYSAPQPPTPPAEEKKTIFGVEQTKAEFTDYVRREFGRTVDGKDLVSSSELVQRHASLDRDLRMAINGLEEATLHSYGLRYVLGSGLATLGQECQVPLSTWIDTLWAAL